MKKTFKCALVDRHYFPAGVCFYHLSELFFLDDSPNHIDIIVSDKPSPNSYMVKKLYGDYWKDTGKIDGVKVKTSNGRWLEFYITERTDRILDTLPNTFYVSVMA